MIRQAATTVERNNLVQTEVAGRRRGDVTRHSGGVHTGCGPWERTSGDLGMSKSRSGQSGRMKPGGGRAFPEATAGGKDSKGLSEGRKGFQEDGRKRRETDFERSRGAKRKEAPIPPRRWEGQQMVASRKQCVRMAFEGTSLGSCCWGTVRESKRAPDTQGSSYLGEYKQVYVRSSTREVFGL